MGHLTERQVEEDNWCTVYTFLEKLTGRALPTSSAAWRVGHQEIREHHWALPLQVDAVVSYASDLQTHDRRHYNESTF